MASHATVALDDEDHDDDRLLTQAETLQKLNLKSDRTLRNWARRGEGPRRIRIGGSIRYRAADVQQWIEDQYVA